MTPQAGQRRLRTVVVLAVTVLTYLCAAVAFFDQILLLELQGQRTATKLTETVGFGMAFLGLPAVGAVLTVHRPGNPIGRTLLGFGTGVYVLLFVGVVSELTVERTGTVGGPLLWLAGLLSAASPVLLALLVHLLLYFPNGVLEGRARWLATGTTALTAFLVAARLLRPVRLDAAVEVANPYGQPWAAPLDELVGPATVAVLALGVVALARLVLRFRQGDPTERAQFRWILLSLGSIPPLFGMAVLADVVVDDLRVTTVILIGSYNLGFLGFALALYRAVTKHNLYGIGRVVSRTVTYAVLVTVLAGVYLGSVVVLGAAARALTGESGDAVVALSTLAVAALFQPLRRRTRVVVDRRFNRARYDAARTVDAFGRELRDQVSLDAMFTALRSTTSRTVQPGCVGVVLVGGQQS